MKNNQFCRLRSQCVPYTMGFLDVMLHILRHWRTFFSFIINVIRGPRPANLDCRITSGNDSKVECVTSGNDGHRWRLFSGCKYPSPADKSATSPARGEVLNNITFKGLDVVRQYAALLERRVQSSTRAQKFLADGVQYGRSMIEMLGVLAIIGVLSVAGIAGYSKAMTKWKINKTIEQIEQITHGIFTVYANQKKMDNIYSNEEDDINLLKSLDIISEDMIKDDNELKDEYDIRLKNPFGGDLWLGAGLFTVSYPGHSGEKGVDFEYYNIPREACMALGSLDWSKGSASVIGVGISPNTNDAKANASECWVVNGPSLDYGDWLLVCNTGVPGENSEQTEADRIPLPIPLDIVAEHCNCKDNDCYFSVSFTDK